MRILEQLGSSMNIRQSWLLGWVFLAAPAVAVEKLGYEVIENQAIFEVREYDAHVLATVTVAADFDEAGNRAFRDLFNFIDGANDRNQSIAMTAPVLQKPAGERWDISFVMPASLQAASTPAPDAQHINIVSEPPARMAALTYSGNWSRTRYLEKERALRSALAKAGYTACGESRFARHNPPFWPSFLRTNEVLIPLCANPRLSAR